MNALPSLALWHIRFPRYLCLPLVLPVCICLHSKGFLEHLKQITSLHEEAGLCAPCSPSSSRAPWLGSSTAPGMPLMTLHSHPIHRADDTSASQIVTLSKTQQSTQAISVWSLYALRGQGTSAPCSEGGRAASMMCCRVLTIQLMDRRTVSRLFSALSYMGTSYTPRYWLCLQITQTNITATLLLVRELQNNK